MQISEANKGKISALPTVSAASVSTILQELIHIDEVLCEANDNQSALCENYIKSVVHRVIERVSK